MTQDRKHKNISNSIWNLLDILLYPITFFLSVPIFIKALGADYFGIWMLVNTVLVGMQVFNFGLGPGVLKNIAWQIGKGNDAAQKSILNNSLSLTAILFALSITITTIIALMIAYTGLFSIAQNLKVEAAWCIALTGGMVGFRFLEQVFSNYFKAHENFRIAAIISISNRLLPLAINLIMLSAQVKIVGLIISILICNAIIAIACFIYLFRSISPYRFAFQLNLKNDTSRFSIVLWLQSLCMILIFQADRYLVVSHFGLAVLSYYALTATIFNHLHMGFNAVIGWVAPKFTKYKAQEIATEQLYQASKNLVLIVSVNALLLFYFLHPFVYNIVLGSDTAKAVGSYTPYFIMMEIALAQAIIPTYYLNATGYEKKYLLFLIAFATSTVISMLIAVYYFQSVITIIAVLIVANAIGMIVQHLMAQQHLLNNTKYALIQNWLLLPILSITYILYPKQWWGIAALISVWLYTILFISKTGKREWKHLFNL